MTKNKSAVIAFFMAFSGVVMASDVPVQNHTELKPTVSRIFGWAIKKKPPNYRPFTRSLS